MQDEGRAGRALPASSCPKDQRAPGSSLRSPTHSIPEGDSGYPESPDGRDLPSPGPVGMEPAFVPVLSSRCFCLWGRTE